jgi:hypothetical protein
VPVNAAPIHSASCVGKCASTSHPIMMIARIRLLKYPLTKIANTSACGSRAEDVSKSSLFAFESERGFSTERGEWGRGTVRKEVSDKKKLAYYCLYILRFEILQTWGFSKSIACDQNETSQHCGGRNRSGLIPQLLSHQQNKSSFSKGAILKCRKDGKPFRPSKTRVIDAFLVLGLPPPPRNTSTMVGYSGL